MATDGGVRTVYSELGEHVKFATKKRLQALRRFQAHPTNQSIITAFGTLCAFVVMVIYLETSRMLIPSKVVSKQELHSLTSGFTNDLQHSKDRLDPHLTADLLPHHHRPKALIVGFSHCGAQTIASALASHPDVVVNRKKLNYFTGDRPFRWYIAHMPPSLNHQLTIDICLSCITNKTALEKVKTFNETMKIIVVVCDPISRLLTHYIDHLHHRDNPESGLLPNTDHFIRVDLDSLKAKFSDQTPLTTQYFSELGDYFRFTINLFQLFSRKQVIIMEQERFSKNFTSELSRLHSFLGVASLRHSKDVTYDQFYANTFCSNATDNANSRTCIQDSSLSNVSHLFTSEYSSLLDSLRKFYRPFNKRMYLYLDEWYDWL